MTIDIDKEKWVFIIIQNPGVDEQIVGLHDKEAELDFIPAFMEKETAEECFINMERERGVKYEVQAIIFEELESYASENNFRIFFLNAQGKVLKKM